MANSLCFSPVISCKSSHRTGTLFLSLFQPNPNVYPREGVAVVGSSAAGNVFKFNDAFQHHGNSKFQSLVVKATDGNQSTKPNSTKSNSIVCTNCDGNGAIQCSQCQGSGVNSVDHFNGQFKAGGLCWLCRGKRDILCGDCNGAGFIGGFMSTFDD